MRSALPVRTETERTALSDWYVSKANAMHKNTRNSMATTCTEAHACDVARNPCMDLTRLRRTLQPRKLSGCHVLFKQAKSSFSCPHIDIGTLLLVHQVHVCVCVFVCVYLSHRTGTAARQSAPRPPPKPPPTRPLVLVQLRLTVLPTVTQAAPHRVH